MTMPLLAAPELSHSPEDSRAGHAAVEMFFDFAVTPCRRSDPRAKGAAHLWREQDAAALKPLIDCPRTMPVHTRILIALAFLAIVPFTLGEQPVNSAPAALEAG